jgi:hypothetical protein
LVASSNLARPTNTFWKPILQLRNRLFSLVGVCVFDERQALAQQCSFAQSWGLQPQTRSFEHCCASACLGVARLKSITTLAGWNHQRRLHNLVVAFANISRARNPALLAPLGCVSQPIFDEYAPCLFQTLKASSKFEYWTLFCSLKSVELECETEQGVQK